MARRLASFDTLQAMRRRPPPTAFRRSLQRYAAVLACALVLVYPLDWGIWRIRQSFGKGMGSADVTETTAATLKGDRFEVYSQQSTTVNCSRSLLPEAGAGACWWLHRHPSQVTQY